MWVSPWYWKFWGKNSTIRVLVLNFETNYTSIPGAFWGPARDLDWVLPIFSRSLKTNMAAAIGVHLGYTCASLAIYKVDNQLLWKDLFIFFVEKYAVIHFCSLFKDGRTEIIANDAGDRVTPALVACSGKDMVGFTCYCHCIFWIVIDSSLLSHCVA